MDYKQKYEQALENLKKIMDANKDNKSLVDFIEYKYPELKESDNEKIRKFISHELACLRATDENGSDRYKELTNAIAWLEKQGEKTNPYSGISFEYNGHIWGMCARDNGVDILLDKQLFKHLEKQGEQKHLELKAGHWYFCHQAYCERADILTVKEGEVFKCEKDGIVKGLIIKEPEKYFREISTPSDEVEPKFKVGDFIVSDYCIGKVIELTDDAYLLDSGQGIPFSCEDNAHLWTIQDAKDGDVLYYKDPLTSIEYIVTSRGVNRYGNVDSYFRYNSVDGFGINIPSVFSAKSDDITPATKEQRDLLFQMMKEAGYEWDSEKKELRKIEQKHVEWSEEDKTNRWTGAYLTRYLSCLQRLGTGNPQQPETINSKWFKEHCRPQPKQGWSEEDETGLGDALWAIEQARIIAKDENDMGTCWSAEQWLKSLKQRMKGEAK